MGEVNTPVGHNTDWGRPKNPGRSPGVRSGPNNNWGARGPHSQYFSLVGKSSRAATGRDTRGGQTLGGSESGDCVEAPPRDPRESVRGGPGGGRGPRAHTIRFLSPRQRIFLKARRKSWLKMVYMTGFSELLQ